MSYPLAQVEVEERCSDAVRYASSELRKQPACGILRAFCFVITRETPISMVEPRLEIVAQELGFRFWKECCVDGEWVLNFLNNAPPAP